MGFSRREEAAWALFLSMMACRPSPPALAGSGSPAQRPRGGPPALIEEPIRLPATIQDVFRVPPSRTVIALDDVTIGPNGRLEISAGDFVKVASRRGLYVRGGQLVASGTSDRQIVFTSMAEKPGPGDWCGVIFNASGLPRDRSEPWPTSTLENVVVEFAGRPCSQTKGVTKAAGISIVGYLGNQKRKTLAGAILLKGADIRNNASRGIDAQSDAPLSVSGLKFGKNAGVSMTIDLAYADRLAPAATEAVELLGTILRTPLQLPLLDVPYVVVESVEVGSWANDPLAVLTIPSGSILRFKKGTGLSVGGHFPGKIEARGVTFTSAEPTPQPGDWEGIEISDDGEGDFSEDTFEYAGANGQPVFVSSTKGHSRLEVRASKFRKNRGPAFGEPLSCNKWKSSSRGNSFENQPACVLNKHRKPGDAH